MDEWCFLSDEDIARTSRYCMDIEDTASLQKVLTQEKQIAFSPLAPYVTNLITVIRATVNKPQPLQQVPISILIANTTTPILNLAPLTRLVVEQAVQAMSDTNRKGRPLSTHKEFVEPLLSHIMDPQERQVAIAEARRQHENNEEKRLHRLALNRDVGD